MRMSRDEEPSQMIMVAHQAGSMDLPLRFQTGFREGFEEILPVNIVNEDVRAAGRRG